MRKRQQYKNPKNKIKKCSKLSESLQLNNNLKS